MGLKNKLNSMLLLTIGSSVVIYYVCFTQGFHEACIHLFYIPVIMAVSGMGQKGLWVPLILEMVLITMQLFFDQSIIIQNELIRYGMFTIVGYVFYMMKLRWMKSREELKNSRSELELCLEGSPIPTFIIDTNHRVRYWNRALENLSGISKDVVIGTRKHWKAFYKKKRPCMADILIDKRQDDLNSWYKGNAQKSLLIHDAYEGKDFFSDLGNDGKWLRFTATVLKDASGTLYGAIQTVEDISAQVAAENELRENEKKYKKLSITDGLTGLYNSRHFYAQLSFEIDRFNRYKEPLSLLMVDIDNFKDYNDTYGHLEGDKVLIRLGQVMLKCLRATDSAYRYGGEEFILILPETEGTAAVKLAERIRAEFKKAALFPDKKIRVHKTISIGVAQYEYGEVLSVFVNRADQNMYQAKEDGKNRVCFSREA